MWYHYFDAQEVFNSIRVYVGAYVWMTGYGITLPFFFFISENQSIFMFQKYNFARWHYRDAYTIIYTAELFIPVRSSRATI